MILIKCDVCDSLLEENQMPLQRIVSIKVSNKLKYSNGNDSQYKDLEYEGHLCSSCANRLVDFLSTLKGDNDAAQTVSE